MKKYPGRPLPSRCSDPGRTATAPWPDQLVAVSTREQGGPPDELSPLSPTYPLSPRPRSSCKDREHRNPRKWRRRRLPTLPATIDESLLGEGAPRPLLRPCRAVGPGVEPFLRHRRFPASTPAGRRLQFRPLHAAIDHADSPVRCVVSVRIPATTFPSP